MASLNALRNSRLVNQENESPQQTEPPDIGDFGLWFAPLLRYRDDALRVVDRDIIVHVEPWQY